MIRRYKIIYKPYNDVFEYLSEGFLFCGLAEIGLLIFVLVNQMFKEDIIGAFGFILLPVVACLFLLISGLILKIKKLEINYIDNVINYRGIFKRFCYSLDEISFLKKVINNTNTNDLIITIVYVIYKDKKIYKFNGSDFEAKTSFNVNSLINWK